MVHLIDRASFTEVVKEIGCDPDILSKRYLTLGQMKDIYGLTAEILDEAISAKALDWKRDAKNDLLFEGMSAAQLFFNVQSFVALTQYN